MISKQKLIESIEEEVRIVKHLATKIKAEHLKYRPAENMRTTQETLQYLSACGIAAIKSGTSENKEVVAAYLEQAKQVTLDTFAAAMDRELAEIKELLNSFSEEELLSRQVNFPWGQSEVLGMAFVNTTLKFLTAYRMQLFVYLKSAGMSELNTMNCWAGIDS